MKKSLGNCAAVAASLVICLSCITQAHGAGVSNIKPYSDPTPIEGRSLLDLLLGATGEGNAATSVKGSTSVSSEKASPLTELAQSLIGKDNANANLYIKIFKLILNLFMDVMMDRMDVDRRREDTSSSPVFTFLKPKNLIVKRSSSPVFERPVESIVERQRVFKPYFLE